MSVECKRTCVGCPALNFLGRQLNRNNEIRNSTQQDAFNALDVAEEIKTAVNPVAFDGLKKRIEARIRQSKVVFACLDRAEMLLTGVGTDLKEACADGQPYIITDPDHMGRQVLQCSSERAAELVPRHSSRVLAKNE